MGITKAPGTVTVGVDKLGKHYMYRTGEGRGRQPLHLNQAQANALKQRGLAPGKPLSLGLGEVQQLTGGGGSPSTGKAPVPSDTDLAIDNNSARIIESHHKWFASGAGKTSQGATDRLKQILTDQNINWLEAGQHAPTAAHKNFAGAILATIFGKDFGHKDPKNPGKSTKNQATLSITFNPGGDGGTGRIGLTNSKGESRGSLAFNDLRELVTKDLRPIRDDYAQSRHDTATPPPGSHNELYAKAEKIIDSSPGVSDKNKTAYKESMRHVLNRMPKVAADRIAKNVKHVRFHESWDQVTEHIRSIDPNIDKNYGSGTKARGGYQNSTGTLILDGGETDDNSVLPQGYHNLLGVKGIYAHELGHAIDHKHEFSSSPEWKSAWGGEAGSVSDYSKHSTAEGFAEFSRLVYSGDASRENIQSNHPKMYGFFESKGLLPDRFAESQELGATTKLDELFDTPMVTPKVQADGLKIKSEGVQDTGTPKVVKTKGKKSPKSTPEQTKHLGDFTEEIKRHEGDAPHAPTPEHIEAEHQLHSTGRRVYERPMGKDKPSKFQVYNTKTNRFEGDQHDTHTDAVLGRGKKTKKPKTPPTKPE